MIEVVCQLVTGRLLLVPKLASKGCCDRESDESQDTERRGSGDTRGCEEEVCECCSLSEKYRYVRFEDLTNRDAERRNN